jgi:hypothetical protein
MAKYKMKYIHNGGNLNMKNKRKGISLIVLVITIIVIIILAGTVVLSLSKNNPISSATEATFKASEQEYNSELAIAISTKYASNSGFDSDTLYAGIWNGNIGAISGTVREFITSMTAADGLNYIIQKGRLTYVGSDTSKITWSENLGIQNAAMSDYIDAKGVNKPKLVTGMTPVKWNVTTNVWDTVIDPNTDNWYNYVAQGTGIDGTSQWANAKTLDGSMWVWIPRYVYNISSGWHTSTAGTINIQFSKGINDLWNGAINTDSSSAASDFINNGGKFTSQPAFTFGSTELTGIWVAKYEAGNNSGKITVLPNISSWRSIDVSNMFTSCRVMETDNIYGWGTTGSQIDTHMIKNVEWGAVAYLTHSKYGRNGNQIWINPDFSFITGRAGAIADSGVTATTFAYDTVNGIKASTTGNTYGIYDMSGCAWEYTASYVNKGNANLANGTSLVNASAQYKDVYNPINDTRQDNYTLASAKKGDAVYETSNGIVGSGSWFGDYSYMPYLNTPFVGRSGDCGFATSSGVFAFAFESSGTGGPSSNIGFRPSLVISNGL